MINATALNILTPVLGSTANTNATSGKSDAGFFQVLSQALNGEKTQPVDGTIFGSEQASLLNEEILLLLDNLSSKELGQLLLFVRDLIARQRDGEDLELFAEEDVMEIHEKFVSVEQFLEHIIEIINAYQAVQAQRQVDDSPFPVAKEYFSLHQYQYQKETFLLRENLSVLPELDTQIFAMKTSGMETTESMNKSQMVEVIKALLSAAEKQEFSQHGLTARAEATVHLAALQNQNGSVPKGEITAQSEMTSETANAALSVQKTSVNTENEASMGQHQEQRNAEAQAGLQKFGSDQEISGKLNTQMVFADNVVSTARSVNQTEMKMTYTSSGQFQRQIEELVVNQAKLVTKPNGQQTIRIALHPEHLGSLQVTVVAKEGQVTATIITDTVAAKELLESSINSLRTAMVHTGIQIDRIDVQQNQTVSSLTQPTTEAQGYLHHQRKEKEQQEQQQSKKDKNTGSFSLEELEELALDFINENQLDKRFIYQDDLATSVNYTV